MAGVNGTVSSVTTNNGVTTVVVAYPAQPGPPPVPAGDEVYTPVPSEEADTFRAAFSGNTKIDCTGTAPNCGSVTAHR